MTDVSCHGHVPNVGCPGGCGTAANQAWWNEEQKKKGKKGKKKPWANNAANKLNEPGSNHEEFKSLLLYMFDEMMINSASDAASVVRERMSGECDGMVLGGRPGVEAAGCGLDGYAAWYDLVAPEREWDHKGLILDSLDMLERGNTFTELPDSDEEISYEVWSNIHYGYVGIDVGLSSGELHTGANAADAMQFRTPDHGDGAAINIGISLRRKYTPAQLTPERVYAEILLGLDALRSNGKVRSR